MMPVDPYILLIVAVASFAAACAALWTFALRDTPKHIAARNHLRSAESEIVFLFDDEDIIDASPSAQRLLKTAPQANTPYQTFLAALRPRFPDLQSELSNLGETGRLKMYPSDTSDPVFLIAELWDGIAKIEICHPTESGRSPSIDPDHLRALEDELRTLRATTEHAPYMVWQQTRDGAITWANQSYLTHAQEMRQLSDQEINTWPPERLFHSISLAQGSPEGRAHRAAVQFPDRKQEHWFDCYSAEVGEHSVHFAVDADAVVRAEAALRDFVQTLTKTFAHIPIGLAIFNRDRQLALFNPALTDLTNLPPDFLSSRPTFFSFLDGLRERQMVPEPKDYKSWRQHMIALEAAASDGTYEETWTLPAGQTYRVTGRPHPDGAVAFLFEDISSEISLTRHFRAELEVGQAVLDSFDEAICVFSSNGLLTLSNAAYTNLWGVDPSTTFGEMTIADAARSWQETFAASPVWDRIRDYASEQGERAPLRETVQGRNGALLECTCVALAGASTRVSFLPRPLPRLRQPTPSGTTKRLTVKTDL